VTGLQELLGAAHIVLALLVSAHIVLHKDDVRAAIGWTGLVWLTPVVGSVLYGLFGINRIRRQAGMLRRGRALADAGTAELASAPARHPLLAADAPASLQAIAATVGRATGLPLTGGNAVEPLVNGDEAYPAMISAIDDATRRVWLATYIFDRGRAGDRFVDALGRAAARGVKSGCSLTASARTTAGPRSFGRSRPAASGWRRFCRRESPSSSRTSICGTTASFWWSTGAWGSAAG
jgi:cardiolipin synthase A/B